MVLAIWNSNEYKAKLGNRYIQNLTPMLSIGAPFQTKNKNKNGKTT